MMSRKMQAVMGALNVLLADSRRGGRRPGRPSLGWGCAIRLGNNTMEIGNWLVNGRGNLRCYGPEPRFSQISGDQARADLNGLQKACLPLKDLAVEPLVGEGKSAAAGQVCVSFRFGQDRGTVTLRLPEQRQALEGLLVEWNRIFQERGWPAMSLKP